MMREVAAGKRECLPDGEMKAVDLEGTRILLVALKGHVLAVGADCPHAGGPLEKGVLSGDRIICPWHKAAFCLRDGSLLEPPALDSLPAFAMSERDGELFVSLPDSPVDAVPPRAAGERRTDRCAAIIGTGAAGAAAAQTLAEIGFPGRIVLIGPEDGPPYDRTIQSKYVLAGTQGKEKSPLQEAGFYAHHGIERLWRDIVGLDPVRREIVFSDHAAAEGAGVSGMTYDCALVATGGIPKRPDMPGATLGNVFLLRSASDAARIAAAAAVSSRAVVIGASFIAMEAAASLRERGLDVTIVAPQSVPFEAQLGAEIGQVFTDLHRQKGVTLRLGEAVAAIEGDGVARGIRLESGDTLPADFVVIGMGVTPATAFLDGVALREDGGMMVDARLAAAPNLYAAGDIAAFPLYGDGAPVRIEHWRLAEQQGRLAARNMAGADLPFRAIPYFWTIQFGKRLDYVGHAETWDEIVVDGDLQKPDFIAYYIVSGHVAAAVGFARDRDMAALIELMGTRRDWRADQLVAAGGPAAMLALS